MKEKGTANFVLHKDGCQSRTRDLLVSLRKCKSQQIPAGSWGWGSRPGVGCWPQGQRGLVPRGSTSRMLLAALLLKLDQQVDLACQLQQQGLWQGKLLPYTQERIPVTQSIWSLPCLLLRAIWHFWQGSWHTVRFMERWWVAGQGSCLVFYFDVPQITDAMKTSVNFSGHS